MSEKIQFETFKDFGLYEIGNMQSNSPSCFNGMVRFKKYRVTIEEIPESVEVYHERLQKMWDECKNHHHWRPLEDAGKSVGLKLEFGKAGTR